MCFFNVKSYQNRANSLLKNLKKLNEQIIVKIIEKRRPN